MRPVHRSTFTVSTSTGSSIWAVGSYLAIGKGKKRWSSKYKVFSRWAISSFDILSAHYLSRTPFSHLPLSRSRRQSEETGRGSAGIARHVQGENDVEIESEADAEDLVAALDRSPVFTRKHCVSTICTWTAAASSWNSRRLI